MAKKQTKKKEHPGTGHTCGECAHVTWSDKQWNKDVNGVPFLGDCKYATWHRTDTSWPLTLRGCDACEHFEPKQQ